MGYIQGTGLQTGVNPAACRSVAHVALQFFGKESLVGMDFNIRP
jgi:hypothetical protein